MKFERRKLSDLRPAEYNPRKKLTPEDKEYQDIKRSILEFGYADPIVINFDGTIIKGHQRRTVMMDLGYEDAEVIVLDIQDKTKEKALNTALNKITGKWDNQLLKDLLVELDLEGYDFSVTGFQRTDLEDLIQLTEVPPEAQEDDFDPDAAAEAIDVPVSRAGSIWRLGRHRLMCGDATDPDDVAQLLSGEKLDLVITTRPTMWTTAQRRSSSKPTWGRKGVGRTAPSKTTTWTPAVFTASCWRHSRTSMRPCGPEPPSTSSTPKAPACSSGRHTLTQA